MTVRQIALRTFALLALTMALGASFAVTQAAAVRIKIGVYTGELGQEAAPANPVALDEYSQMVGRKPDVVLDYRNPTQPLLTASEVATLEAGGETPMITWELYKSGWDGAPMKLQEIIGGDYDSYFRQAAQLAKSLPFEVMIRFAQEMNGDWYPWSGSPTDYTAAWRHTVSIFKEEGATNVKWVWSPNVDSGYPFAAYFPGERWVDYVALDGYNWGTAGIGEYGWQSLQEVFGHSYAELTQLSSKPVILAETASGEQGGNKAQWIREGFLKTIPTDFPRVMAVIWFNTNKEEDWRVNSSQASLDAFREVVASPLYGGSNGGQAAEAPVKVESLAVRPNTVGTAPVSAGRSADTAPVSAKQSAGRRRVCRRKTQLRVRYRLSRQAKVRIVVHFRTRHRGKKRRLRYVVNSPWRAASVGLGCLMRGRHLRPGRYSVSATAVDRRGRSRSKTRTARLRVRKAGGHGRVGQAVAVG